MKLSKLYIVGLLPLGLLVCTLEAKSTTLQLIPEQEQYEIGYVQLLEDTAHRFEIADILSPRLQARFNQNEQAIPSIGYSKSAYWLKLRIRNRSEEPTWLLELAHPPLDDVRLYYPDSAGHYQLFHTGDQMPFHKRPFKNNNYLFPLSFATDTAQSYYMRVSSESSISLPLKLWTRHAFLQKERNVHLAYGLYFGMLLVMVFYNLLLCFAFRDLNYLYYVFFIGAIGIVQFILNGYAFEHIWPGLPWWNNVAAPFFIGATLFGALLFSKRFLMIHEYSPLLNKAIIFLIGGSMLIMCAAFLLSYRVAAQLADYVVVVGAVTTIAAGIVCRIKGYRPARFYLLAWTGLLIGALLLSLQGLGVLPYNIVTQNSIYAGVVLMVIFLTQAMNDRIHLIRKSRERAREKLIQELRKKDRLREKVNRELEEKVQERTREIQGQKAVIEAKNHDLVDSINYAQRIQEAMLPPDDYLRESLPESFVFFKPRDIVSGDFYWVEQKNGHVVVAAVDCTGHGVPGAFVSMIGHQLLNKLVLEKQLSEPGRILQHLNDNVKNALKQDREGSYTQDGMDIALCTLKRGTGNPKNEVLFAGAQRPIYRVRKGKLYEEKGDGFPIGGHTPKQKTFKTHRMSLQKGDMLYIFTDGYADQFGGPKGKKFMRKAFKKLLQQIAANPVNEQKRMLDQTFHDWKQQLTQVDDVLVIGFRV